MTLLHGARSGDLVRARRRHHVPAGPAELRLHRDHGLEHGRGHPVGFQWVMEARERGARVIHVDPRFTRTSAMATTYVRLRAGSDIAFLGGIVQLHPRARPRVPRVRRHLHERARHRRRGLPRHRGARRPVLRLGPREEAPTTPRRGSTPGMEVHGAAGQREQGANQGEAPAMAPTAARSSTVSRPRSTRRSSTRAASSSCCGATSRATRRSWSRRSAACPREQFLAGGRGAVPELRPRAHVGVLLRRRLDAAHRRRPVHPHRGHHAAPARQHRPAGRRHHGAARARVDPGLDRHPDALQHPARLPPDAARRSRTPTCDAFLELNTSPSGFWGNMGAYMVSLLKAWWGDRARRPRTTSASTTCRASPATTRSTRRRSACSTARSRASSSSARTRPSAPRTRRLHRLAMAKLEWLVVRDLVEIETATFWYDSPEVEPASCAPRTSRPRCSSCPPPRTPRRTAPSRTPSACCSGTTRRSSRRATAARSCGSTTTSAASSARSWPAQRRARPAAARPAVALPDEPARSPTPAPRRCCARSTAGTANGGALGLHAS